MADFIAVELEKGRSGNFSVSQILIKLSQENSSQLLVESRFLVTQGFRLKPLLLVLRQSVLTKFCWNAAIKTKLM